MQTDYKPTSARKCWKDRATYATCAFAITVVFGVLAAEASAQTTQAAAVGQSASDAGAMAQTGAITFEASEQRRHTSISTTPSVYAPPSMFGGANNCMGSDTFAGSVTGIGVGMSKSKESDNCNTREDTAIAAKLGYMDVAALRFFCFGESENRMAFEAAGHVCPQSGTAKGIEGAPVGPKFAVAPAVAETQRYRIMPDGSTVRVQ